MLVSRNLLIEFANNFKKVNEQDFINSCNKVGIEIEQIIKHPITNGLEVVKIISIKKHPNADKLNLVEIQLPNNEVKQIVCGANNLKTNYYAIYAASGVVLHNNLKLEKRNIRGIESDGMLCAISELTDVGIEYISNESKEGIIIFDQQIHKNDIVNFLGLDDVIYDLSIPSNRNDLNSIYCLLAELSISLNLEFNLQGSFTFPEKDSNLKINVQKDICSDFGVILLNNDNNKFNLSLAKKQILSSCGYKVNNNFLDVLNLIFILSGNPIHAYDNDVVKNNIEIKTLTNKIDEFLALDDKNYTLSKDIIIAMNSDNEIISLPYIIGSKSSMFKNTTRNILVEVGNFDHLKIRKGMNDTKISSKSSIIGNKKVSTFNTQLAFSLLISFLEKEKIEINVNYDFGKLEGKTVDVDFDRMSKFIGVHIDKNEISSSMNKSIFKFDNNKCHIHPSRLDIDNQYDIFEETMKFIDINKLELSPISFNILSFDDDSYQNHFDNIDNFLLNQGFMQVKTYNLTSLEKAKSFDYLELFANININNPISNIREYLKSNSINEMLEIIQYNFARKHKLFNIFETNKIQTSLNDTYNILNILLVDDFYLSKVTNSSIINEITNIKSFIKTMLIDYDINFELSRDKIEILSNNKCVGHIFLIPKSTTDKFDLKDYKKNIYGVVLNLDLLFVKPSKELKQVSTFPYVLRDYNFKLEKGSNKINQILLEIRKINNVNDAELIDLFEKDGYITYTVSIIISSTTKTLTTDEINDIMAKIEKIKY